VHMAQMRVGGVGCERVRGDSVGSGTTVLGVL
jgi:hypothetical protein